jgi:DNA-binding CsgD family transcriptional regulator
MNQSPATNQIFGRQRELTQLTQILDDAIASSTQLTLLVGEPGIGKTRLVEELAEIATGKNVTVAWGACLDGGGAPPHWPWIQILESLNRQLEGGIAALQSASIEKLAPLLPELGLETPTSGKTTNPTNQTDEEFGIGRAIREVISRTASQNPLLLIIEDVHWSDEASLATINLLANSIRDLPILILITYRDTDVSRTHALASILPSLTRAPNATRIPIVGLESDDIGTMLTELAGDSAEEIQANDIATRTGGNPFFIREIAAALENSKDNDSADTTIPEGIREAIGRRLTNLTSESLEILRVGSLVGRTFDAAIISEILDQGSTDKIAEDCEGLVELGILVESPTRLFSYTFSHSLFQETINAEISTSQRVRYHARIAATLDEKHGMNNPALLAEIAIHYLESELLLGPDKAIEFSVAASQHAYDLKALDSAIQLADQAIELARTPEHADLGNLLYLRALALGHAANAQYPFQIRWDAVQAAFDHFAARDEHSMMIDTALINLPIASVKGPHKVASHALELIDDTDPRKPWLSLRLGVSLDTEFGNSAEAIKIFTQVADEAEATGNTQLLTLAEAHLCQSHLYIADFESSIRHGKKSIALAHENGEWGSAGRVFAFLLRAMCPLGQAKELVEIIEGVDRSQIDPFYRTGSFIALSFCHLVRGEWAAASASRNQWLEQISNAEGFSDKWSIVPAHQGSKADWLDDFNDEINLESKYFKNMIGPYAITALIAFDLTGDSSLLTQAREATGSLDSYTFLSTGTNLRKLAELDMNSLLAIAENDVESARRLLPQLAEFNIQFSPYAGVSFDRVQARLHMLLYDPSAATSLFEAALTFTEKAEYWPEYVRSSVDYAKHLTTIGNTTRANEVITAGITQSQRLEMDLYTDKLTELQSQLAKTTASSEPESTTAYPDNLTKREVEVLQLIAVGHSNQQIADELFLSRYTIVRHVANIFSKIGTANRTEATTYAHQHNLIQQPATE